MICQKTVEMSKMNWYKNKLGSVLNPIYSNLTYWSGYKFLPTVEIYYSQLLTFSVIVYRKW